MKLFCIFAVMVLGAAGFGEQGQGWKAFQFDKGFTVQVPSPPGQVPSPGGGAEKRWSSSDPDVTYTFGYTEATDVKLTDEEWVNAYVNRISRSSAVPVLDLREFATNGYPTVQLTIRTSSGQLLAARVIRLQNAEIRLYASYRPGDAPTESIDRFFSSLVFPRDYQQGTLTHFGPDLREITIETKGISFKMPGNPQIIESTVGQKEMRGLLTRYESESFGIRFVMGYRVLSVAPVTDDFQKSDFCRRVGETIAQVLGAYAVRRNAGLRGLDVANYFILDLPKGREGKLITVLHGSYLVGLYVDYPSSMSNLPEVDAFFSSLTFKD